MDHTPLEGADVGSVRAGGVAGVEEPIDFGLATSGILGDAFSAGDFGAAGGGFGFEMKTTIVSIKTEDVFSLDYCSLFLTTCASCLETESWLCVFLAPLGLKTGMPPANKLPIPPCFTPYAASLNPDLAIVNSKLFVRFFTFQC